MSSAFEPHTPVITDTVPNAYFADFQPVGMRPAPAGVLVSASIEAQALRQPLNVLMLVMESVGANCLGLYGASFDDTPNLVELAHHALVFDRVFAAEAETSAALGALFTSVYPDHDWPSVTQLAPALSIPGLPGILSREGWQGEDVLGAESPERAYLFAGTGNFSFGLVESDFKYIYNFQRGRAQLYDLAADPGETRNLASGNAYAALTRGDHLRLEAWVSFQNRYLARFENPDKRHAQ